jgi:hypothetical protein
MTQPGALAERIAAFQGRPMYTLDRRSPFTIAEVDARGAVTIVPKTKKPRKISGRTLERAWADLRGQGSLTLKQIEEAHSPRNASYVATLLSIMPGVSFTRWPLTLHYHKPG